MNWRWIQITHFHGITEEVVTYSDVSIPRVGSGRSGNRPSGRVGSGSGIA